MPAPPAVILPCFWASTVLLLPVLCHQLRCRSWLCPHAAPPSADLTRGLCCWGSATGCRLPASARQTSSPDASKAVSAKIRVAGCGSPKAHGGMCVTVGLRAPHCSRGTIRAACTGRAQAGLPALEGLGSCLSPHPGLCCLSDTQHSNGLNQVKHFVLSWNRLTGNLGAKRKESKELNFFYLFLLVLRDVLCGQNHR